MRTCPHLLPSIRHLSFHIAAESPPAELLSWVSCIPPDALLHLELRCDNSGSWQPTLFRAPAVHRVRRLTLDGRCQSDTLRCITTFPLLEELTIVRIDGCSDLDTVGTPAFPKLKVASIDSFISPQAFIHRFLSLIVSAPQLENLRFVYSPADVPHELMTALRSMPPTLKELCLAFFQWNHSAQSPLMDEAILRLPSLETLLLTADMYSSTLFPRLPRTLKSVQLELPRNGLPLGFGDAVLQYVTHATQMKHPLGQVTSIGGSLPGDFGARIGDACSAGGINFLITPFASI
ncbi:hypothetical protein LXA43DRAFT_888270 [Ganoderma leucocontextum]|nr:hypothetical protein LXA43DRAFT_888270 [Ganoderma leucocontextum]